jgi:para-nitrobenzyl esterase
MTSTWKRAVRTRLLTTAAMVCSALFAAPEQGFVEELALQSSCFVALPAGDVLGGDMGASCAFLGIPYAASTAGTNRWRPPQPAESWSPSVLDATTPPTNCPSIAFFGPTPSLSGDENCLMLNIWVSNPPPAKPAPVMVWLHTGAFTGASANFAGTNGRRLAEETGMIVVAPNYRLGAFGFLVHPALAAEAPNGAFGNYGLLDQRAALRWVRRNIAQFGGDPHNVTLAGTSAGGQSVGMHLVSPGSGGLFHRASIQSAYPTSRWMTAAEASIQGQAFASALGCTDPTEILACMRSQSRDVVLTALSQATQQVVEPPDRVFWEPVVDGVVIPAQPRRLFERGAFHRVPTIIGFTRDEGWGAFVNRSFPQGVSLEQYVGWVTNEFGRYASSVLDLYPADLDPDSSVPYPIEALARVTGDAQFVCEGRRLAGLIERTRTPTYLYSYEYEIDTLSLDYVIHGVESNILFGNDYAPPVFPGYALADADLTLHEAMSGYWTRFATKGNPNRGDRAVVHWPAFKRPTRWGHKDERYIVFDSVIREAGRPREPQCDFFERFFFRSILGSVPASPR